MFPQFLRRLFWLVLLVVAQMVIFNYIHLFGYATPLVYVYFLLLFPLGTSRWSILLWGFVCGFLCDVVSLSLGMGAASMTLVAFVQPLLLKIMVQKDAPEDLQPGLRTMGFWSYTNYTAILTALFCLCYFLLQAFTFNHAKDLAIACGSSWLLTFVLCMVFEGLRDHKTSELT
ncbi:MAG: rod shape-determining protein MreD [Bacteroidales bacterium]|nr:rod shape-determining protein MreD [Bacteroidales bacterium]